MNTNFDRLDRHTERRKKHRRYVNTQDTDVQTDNIQCVALVCLMFLIFFQQIFDDGISNGFTWYLRQKYYGCEILTNFCCFIPLMYRIVKRSFKAVFFQESFLSELKINYLLNKTMEYLKLRAERTNFVWRQTMMPKELFICYLAIKAIFSPFIPFSLFRSFSK
jgi:hypothetical protein